MKILFTVHTYYPNKDGVQFVTEYLAEGLVKRGHQVDVLTYMYADRSSIKSEAHNGVNIIRWEAKTVHTFHKGDKIGYQQYVISHQQDYDVMINVGTQTALTDWLFPIFDKITIPKVLYIHSIWDFEIHDTDKQSVSTLAKKLWANYRWKRYYRKYADVFKAYDAVTQLHKQDYSYRLFKEWYGIESHIFENAADNVFFESKGEKPKNFPNHYIINVSNYNDRKNQKECIKLFYDSKVGNDWGLVLIGSNRNAYYDLLVEYDAQRRKELGLKKGEKEVQLLYGVDRPVTCEYIKQADIFLMTSSWEAFPISLTEAMASGVPFVSSNVGIVKHLIGGAVGDDEKERLKLLNSLITNEGLRKEYSDKGHVFALEHFNVDAKVLQLEKLIENIKQNKE